MGRPVSPETKARRTITALRRALVQQQGLVASYRTSLRVAEEKIRIERQMANLCYNACQMDGVPEPVRDCMKRLVEEWDR
jgi:hypothetical protein